MASAGFATLNPVDIDSITPVAQDHLKAIWSATEWGDPPVTTKALAARFGTTPANVTETMKRLASQGLVEYAPYKPATLTETGRRLAIAMVRRHRLIETLLVTTLGYEWDEIHEEAERLEHAATDLLINRIDALLGHPAVDPHGDPIPTSDGRLDPLTGAIRLRDAPAGRYLVRRVSDADPDNLTAANDLGLRPGEEIRLDSAGGAPIVTTSTGTHSVPPGLTVATWATPSD